jgi:beta-galactosidase GanA
MHFMRPKGRADFQDWLRARYGSLDALNSGWGTHFWGHRYGAWGEIQLPDSERHNPSLCLDWQRYYSWLNVRFQRDQVRILRERCPKHFITHNFMGLFPELNYYDLAEDLDFVRWDNYPLSRAAGYREWHMKPYAALTRNRFGRGVGYYVGAIIQEEAFYDALIAELLAAARVRPVVRPPQGVEASVRQGQGKRLLFLINHTEEKKTVAVPAGKRDLITGKKTENTLDLDIHGVAVLRL